MKGGAWGNWDPQEVQQPFQPNPKLGRGLHHHVEAAVDWCRPGLAFWKISLKIRNFRKLLMLFDYTNSLVYVD